MKFGSHILPTYMPELDGELPDFKSSKSKNSASITRG